MLPWEWYQPSSCFAIKCSLLEKFILSFLLKYNIFLMVLNKVLDLRVLIFISEVVLRRK